MPTVEVSFTALPAHVRTARLVALAVARRAGVDDQILDEVRLAVGEACSRAVSLHHVKAPGRPVIMRLIDEQDRFIVEVVDCGSFEDAVGAAEVELIPETLAPDSDGVDVLPDPLPPGFGLAVISGLVEDFEVGAEVRGTRVRMTWPASDVMAPEVR
jgi:anti-sigma regulatory factor (Ser/Thr protein kinase)